MRMPWHVRPAAADQKIEIAPLIRLQHMLDIERAVAARAAVRHRGEFGLRDIQMQPPVETLMLNQKDANIVRLL